MDDLGFVTGLVDKLGSTGVLLMAVIYLYRMYVSERKSRDEERQKILEECRKERDELIKQLITRIDEGNHQVNDLIRKILKDKIKDDEKS